MIDETKFVNAVEFFDDTGILDVEEVKNLKDTVKALALYFILLKDDIMYYSKLTEYDITLMNYMYVYNSQMLPQAEAGVECYSWLAV